MDGMWEMDPGDTEARRGRDEDSSHLLISHYETQNHQDDVEELKNRISQLENLVVTSTLNASSFLDPSTTRLTPHGLIQRVGHLESLLAASELDNQRLEREIQLLNASKQECEGDFFRCIKERDLHLKNLEQDIEVLNVRLAKTTKRISTMEEYINTLPSQEELDDTKEALTKCHLEIDLLQDKVDRQEISLTQSQQNLAAKEVLYKEAVRRIEELQPIAEAQNSFLQGIQNDEPSLLELATLQKTQLLRCAKIIKSQSRKLCDLETEKAELELQLQEKTCLVSSLEENLKSVQFQMENVQKQLKGSEERRRQLDTEVQNLQVRVDQSEKLIGVRRNEMSNLLRLITEVDISIREMNNLISYCQSLSAGDEPSLDVVLGLDLDEQEPTKDDNDNGSEKAEFDVDLEWILVRLKCVREVRGHIKNLRSEVNEIYTDILSSGGSGCRIQ